MEIVQGTATVDSVEAFVADLDAIGETRGVTIQAFDARYVVGREHLERAVELAGRAIERDDAIARDPGVEILLYAAGRRQINRALSMGVSEEECPVVAVVVDWTEGGAGETVTDAEAAAAEALRERLDPAATLDPYDEALVRDFFDVGDAEREAAAGDLADLVCERVALLVVER